MDRRWATPRAAAWHFVINGQHLKTQPEANPFHKQTLKLRSINSTKKQRTTSRTALDSRKLVGIVEPAQNL